MKVGIIFTILLLALAIVEISTTGFVYNYLGIWKLAFIYAITTSIGAALLLTQCKWWYKTCVTGDYFSNGENIGKLMEEQEINYSADRADRLELFFRIQSQTMVFIIAWISIIVPGLITDVFGYVLILIFFIRKNPLEKCSNNALKEGTPTSGAP